jgi:hypothetical protein
MPVAMQLPVLNGTAASGKFYHTITKQQAFLPPHQFLVSDMAIFSDEIVSRTVIFKQCTDNDDGALVSQTFCNLCIPTNLVGNQSSTKSIMIGSLFVLLQQALECDGFSLNMTLACIINKDEEIASTILVATTHVPDFGKCFQSPSHGFWPLCCLGAITVRLQDIPQALHPNHKLLASNSLTDNQEAICLTQSFQPIGIDLNSHFNIIFYPVQTSSDIPTSLWGAATPSDFSLSPSDSISAIQSQNASPSIVLAPPLQSTCDLDPSKHGSSLHVHKMPPCH